MKLKVKTENKLFFIYL